ncbi:MAG: HrpE/YscL family type III secretion apparatus protein [Puniceicoccales bacterium]|jgi:type III secretion protein L|nr:HrpE/YscL family type III secretion apparatus protein [Puniceicoccales bacterium]
MAQADIYEIQIGGFDIGHAGKVLKAKSYAALTEGHEMLSSVRAKCDEILDEARKKSSDIVAAANAQAHGIIEEAKKEKEEEKKRGYSDGLETGKQEVSNVMMDFVTKSANSFAKLENDVTEVVKIALRKIIGKIDKTELLVSVVKNSLQKIKLQKQATLKVSPSEAQLLRDRVDELTKDTPLLEFLDICTDAHLKPGACILETELGVIDASISVQIEAIEGALSKARS